MPSNLSGLLNNFSILIAALFFSFARYFKRYLLIAIMLVSEPEKKADKISAWIEATQIAGFSEDEANKLIGPAPKNNVDNFSIKLRAPLEVREDYILRFKELFI